MKYKVHRINVTREESQFFERCQDFISWVFDEEKVEIPSIDLYVFKEVDAQELKKKIGRKYDQPLSTIEISLRTRGYWQERFDDSSAGIFVNLSFLDEHPLRKSLTYVPGVMLHEHGHIKIKTPRAYFCDIFFYHPYTPYRLKEGYLVCTGNFVMLFEDIEADRSVTFKSTFPFLLLLQMDREEEFLQYTLPEIKKEFEVISRRELHEDIKNVWLSMNTLYAVSTLSRTSIYLNSLQDKRYKKFATRFERKAFKIYKTLSRIGLKNLDKLHRELAQTKQEFTNLERRKRWELLLFKVDKINEVNEIYGAPLSVLPKGIKF